VAIKALATMVITTSVACIVTGLWSMKWGG